MQRYRCVVTDARERIRIDYSDAHKCYVAVPMATFSSFRCMFRDKGLCQVSCNDIRSSFLFNWPSGVLRGVPFRFTVGRAWNGTANAGGSARAPMPRILQRCESLGLQRNSCSWSGWTMGGCRALNYASSTGRIPLLSVFVH